MQYVQGKDREQLTLLPDCVEEYIGEGNPARVIEAFVNSLDMADLGFVRSQPRETGRPPYDPRESYA